MLNQAPAAGHELRCLPVGGGFPKFAGEGHQFAELTDAQIDLYRNRLRRLLNAIVDGFNPDLIHVQRLWLQAHLALETGVPYIASTWGDELPAYRADPRFRVFADQAAENAGRIVVEDEATRHEIVATFGELDGCVTVSPDIGDGSLAWLWQLYRDVIAQRRGGI